MLLCCSKSIINKKNCFLTDLKARVPNILNKYRLEGYFNNYFFLCEKSQELILINSKDIIGKCIFYYENHDFILTDFLNENEHD